MIFNYLAKLSTKQADYASFCPLSTNHCPLKAKHPIAYSVGCLFNLSVPNPIKRRQLRLAFVFFGFGAVETVARIFLDAINHRHVRPPGRVWRSSPGVAAVLKENTRSVKTSNLWEKLWNFPSTYIDNFFSKKLHGCGKFFEYFQNYFGICRQFYIL